MLRIIFNFSRHFLQCYLIKRLGLVQNWIASHRRLADWTTRRLWNYKLSLHPLPVQVTSYKTDSSRTSQNIGVYCSLLSHTTPNSVMHTRALRCTLYTCFTTAQKNWEKLPTSHLFGLAWNTVQLCGIHTKSLTNLHWSQSKGELPGSERETTPTSPVCLRCSRTYSGSLSRKGDARSNWRFSSK